MTQNQSADPISSLEVKARLAQELPAFNRVNLSGIKDVVSQALDLFGRNGIFGEYTSHSVAHINKMLGLSEWIITEDTKRAMSRADYLLIVLSIYFHDLGLVVTREEFDNRHLSGFEQYLKDNLFFGKDGEDYKSEVQSEFKNDDEREKFLYQEFVRANHAKRIRLWIEGKFDPSLGFSESMFKEVDSLMTVLPRNFRNDLALICESHHLADLDNLDKYNISQPYGDSDDETGNVQFAAIILRTVDLLHITSDRTPSVQFRLINPQNPKSQVEWVKQNAVTRIRAKKLIKSTEESGEAVEQADTIEVFADFSSAGGYFGLTSYLIWAEKEIRQSKKWCEAAKIKGAERYDYPWSNIDQSRVNSDGFLKEQFSFSIDQEKILDLLTGHTLYNDPSVVIRELVQNSIDAIKLRNFIQKRESSDFDLVEIKWDSSERILEIIDNGTGMSQMIIENHFLKAGSSRYQDREFKKSYPGFNSISRFGIGVLSCFMISDEVEVITSHSDDEQARHLLLRSVHGKYLISLINKSNLKDFGIDKSGTVIKLKVRQSLEEFDVLGIAKKWILFPYCKIKVYVDDEDAIEIGFVNTASALKYYLSSMGIKAFFEGEDQISNYKIKTVEENGISLSYVTKWSDYFKEWEFYKLDFVRSRNEIEKLPISTCVEGIRVESGTPGFIGYPIAAIANVVGVAAPKTNVARSGLEVTQELLNLLGFIYSAYGKHIESEINNLVKEENFSLTWAVAEAKWLLPPISEDSQTRYRPLRPNLLNEKLMEIPILLVDIGDKRHNMSVNQLNEYDSFWVIDWDFNSSVNNVLKNAPISLSIKSIMKELSDERSSMPEDPILSDPQMHANPYRFAFDGRQIDLIKYTDDLRRLDMRWTKYERLSDLWLSPSDKFFEVISDALRGRDPNLFNRIRSINISLGEVEFIGSDLYDGVRSGRSIYLKQGLPISQLLSKLIGILNSSISDDEILSAATALSLCMRAVNNYVPINSDTMNRYMGEYFDGSVSESVMSVIDEFNSTANIRIFDPSVWRRELKNPGGFSEDY